MFCRLCFALIERVVRCACDTSCYFHLYFIGVGRFRILGWGPRFRILGGGGGGGQIPSRHMTSMRHNDIASTPFRRHVPTRFLINQCQIITFLILKSVIVENSRTELREIVLPAPSNQIKVTVQHLQIKFKLQLLLFYPSTWYICDFFLFHIEIEGKGGWIIGGGGVKGYVGPPLKLLVGLQPPPPHPTLFLRLCTLCKCNRFTKHLNVKIFLSSIQFVFNLRKS